MQYERKWIYCVFVCFYEKQRRAWLYGSVFTTNIAARSGWYVKLQYW